MHMTGYCCFACGASQDLAFSGYICPGCGGNLEVTYDYAKAAKALDGHFPDGDDMFRYAALLPLRETHQPFPLRVGQTPLVAAPKLGKSVGLNNVYLKDDSLLPSASFKDRAGVVAVCRALEVDAPVIATASTGNAGASLACLAAALGMRCVIFVPEKAPPAKIAQLLIFGAQVLAVRGSYDEAFDLCSIACETFGWFNRSTGFNPFTREGKKTSSYEMWEGLGQVAPDWVVVPTGDGNILSGIWKGWRDLRELGWIKKPPRMVCAQSEDSAAITHAVRSLPASPNWSKLRIQSVEATTVADSISVDQPRDGLAAVRAVVESKGDAIAVPDADILAAIPAVARSTGIFAEPAAAAAWAVVKQMAKDGRFRKNDRIVCLITGSGLKDVPRARTVAGEPMTIDPTLDAVRQALPGNGN